MKKKIPQKLKALVLGSIKRHAWNIGVSNYMGDILWMEKDKSTDTKESTTTADIIINRPYLKFILRIYPDTVNEWEKRKDDGNEYVEKIIAHEIAHLATEPLYSIATARYCNDGEMEDARETLTEIVGQLSYKLSRINKKTSKK